MATESRVEYELDDDPIPEGWRFLHNQFGDSGYFALYTDAPKGEMPYKHQTRWFKLRQYTEQRTVTEWVRR